MTMQPMLNILFFTFSAKLTTGVLRQYARRRMLSTTTLQVKAADLRKDYSSKGIQDDDSNIAKGPFAFFGAWFQEACSASVLEPNAMCLATCVNNVPSARVVLMKGYDEKGFVWYTNYNSRKSQELITNPVAALTFWWGELERSVRVEGRVEKVSAEESDTYFNSRPRGSQIGAWSSSQSSEIASRAELDEHERQVQERFRDASVPVPRPPHWGGFRLVPRRVEFWKGRSSRMHDRIVFERDSEDSAWKQARLQP
jgi:pyridoxamine 5'-phosphate oxidase